MTSANKKYVAVYMSLEQARELQKALPCRDASFALRAVAERLRLAIERRENRIEAARTCPMPPRGETCGLEAGHRGPRRAIP